MASQINVRDIEYGCDEENGGIFCDTCGGGNNEGAMGLAESAEDYLMKLRREIEFKINQSRVFIKYAQERDLVDRSRVSMEKAQLVYTRRYDESNDMAEWAEHVYDMILFMKQYPDHPGPGPILETADEVINFRLTEL